jgi:hypothetical protein
MVDLRALRQTISSAPPNGPAAVVGVDWLRQIERDLTELQMRRLKEARQ